MAELISFRTWNDSAFKTSGRLSVMMASSPSCLISTISGFLPERLCPEPGWHWGQDTRTDLLDHLAFEHFAARCQRKGLHSDKTLRHVVFRQTCIGEEIGRASCRERVW